MTAAEVKYDEFSDTFYVSFEPGEQATGVELSDHILLRINKAEHSPALVSIGAKANDVMDRIAIDSFGHFRSLLIPAKNLKATTSGNNCVEDNVAAL